MEPEDLAKLRLLKAADEAADEWKLKAHQEYMAHIQQVLQKGPRGEVTKEMERETGLSRQWLTSVKAGKWSRNPARNPPRQG